MTRAGTDLTGPVNKDAVLSPDRAYRYYLNRVWDDQRPLQCWVMLNPSTADETTDDATIQRCMARSALAGFGGISVVNLFALRSKDPKALYDLFTNPISADDARGRNDDAIRRATSGAGEVICAWGAHGQHMNRGAIIHGKLQEWGVVPKALKLNKDGTPGHPLYVPYSAQPVPF